MRKATGWLSNSSAILEKFGRRCIGRALYCSRSTGGTHALVSGRHAREAALYRHKLCKAILAGCKEQLRLDGRLRDHVVGMVIEEDEAPLEDVLSFAAHERHGVYLDGTTGQPLDPALVVAARAKELEYFNPKQVWTKRRISEAAAKTCKVPISVRWIDTNKGDDDHPNYRSRRVACEIRRRGEDPIIAPTPPLESLRTVLSLADTDVPGAANHVRDGASEYRTQASFIDIARAYFCAQTDPDQPTYVSLRAEDGDHVTMCGLLLKHMYGTWEAADGWHSEYASRLVDDLGFEIGDAGACVFLHKARGLRCSVHGDDLTTCGPKTHLDWFKSELEKIYELTEAHRRGPGPSDDKGARVPNRIVRDRMGSICVTSSSARLTRKHLAPLA